MYRRLDTDIRLIRHHERARVLHEEARLFRLTRAPRRPAHRRSLRRSVGVSMIRIGARLAPDAAHVQPRAR